MPGQGTIDSSSRPWWRPARFFQGLAQPWRPVGMYYSYGSYVPIYDLDPIAPGPGPYPLPVLLQLGARRLDDERRSLLGGLGHERLNPRDHVLGLGSQAVEDHRVGPELKRAGLDEIVVLLVGTEPAKPANQRRRRIDFEDARTLGEVFVRHLQDPLHLGAHAPIRVDQAARAVGQALRLADLADPIAERGPEQLEHAVEAALLGRTLARAGPGSVVGPVSGRSRSAESIEVRSFPW